MLNQFPPAVSLELVDDDPSQRGLYADGKYLREVGGVARALVFGFIDLRGLVLGGSDGTG